jgi:uncharacterized protein
MNPATRRVAVPGPAGTLECAIDEPAGAVRGTAVLCHPHPLHGGTMDNKVVQTLARAVVPLGWRSVRFNFRGIGGSGGAWDDGRGEIDDAMAVIAAEHEPGTPLLLGGFSFGGYVAAHAAQRMAQQGSAVERLVLVAPAVLNFPPPPVADLLVAAPQTLLIHGEADDVVPLAALLEWARPAPLPLTLIPGAGHFFHGQLTLLKNLVLGACR